jgi:hypothetical protein
VSVQEVRWSDDVNAADWIVHCLHPFAQDVGSIIPEGFASCVRIFHPVRSGGPSKLRWAEIAHTNGRIVHPEMQFHAIATPASSPKDENHQRVQPPVDGQMPADELDVLVELLTPFTFTPDDCWFCLWEGYGPLHGGSAVAPPQPGLVPEEVRAGPRVQLPNRAYYLYRGRITDIFAVSRPPFRLAANLWWPEDHAWCVATEIDFAWTYIGGPTRLQAAILADPRLEALPARITDGVSIDSDWCNTT